MKLKSVLIAAMLIAPTAALAAPAPRAAAPAMPHVGRVGGAPHINAAPHGSPAGGPPGRQRH